MPDEMDWSGEPPWRQTVDQATWEAQGLDCARCGQHIPPYWRHFWPPCRRCAVWSVAGACLMRLFGLDPSGQLYRGARPWCDDCAGTGYEPCQPQDLSVLRRSGACATCGAWSFVLVHATAEQHGDIEGSARHYDDEADHEVVVTAAPLVGALNEALDRAGA